MFLRIALFGATLLVFSSALAAQSTEDVQGCKDSKLLTRLPGCFIASCESKDFDQAAIRNGPHKEENDSVLTLEGAVEIVTYECSGKTSPLQIVRNSAAALQRAGFQSIHNGKEENGFLSVTLRKANQWVQVFSYVGGDNNAITFYAFKAVAVSAMKQEMEATADAIKSELETSGRMALYGITFATNSAAIRPESDKALGEIAALLKNQPEWKLTVEGHTDNVGQKSANLALSQKRADAVVAWLASHEVNRARVTAVGLGDTKPVEDNATEEGRAKNRRVELVKR